jgi:hypothetical protein
MKKVAFLLSVAFLLKSTFAQSFLEYRLTLDGQHAIPPNSSPRVATTDLLLYDYGSFGGEVFLVDYRNITSVSLFESTSQQQLGTHLFDFEYGGIAQGINGSPSAAVWNYSTILPPDQIAKVRAGDWWLVVSSTDYPDGELRGQITAVPEPGTVALFILGAASLSILRGRRRTG